MSRDTVDRSSQNIWRQARHPTQMAGAMGPVLTHRAHRDPRTRPPHISATDAQVDRSADRIRKPTSSHLDPRVVGHTSVVLAGPRLGALFLLQQRDVVSVCRCRRRPRAVSHTLHKLTFRAAAPDEIAFEAHRHPDIPTEMIDIAPSISRICGVAWKSRSMGHPRARSSDIRDRRGPRLIHGSCPPRQLGPGLIPGTRRSPP
jgi:hypothetical protein